MSDTELVARLYEALATLPPAERAAAVVAIGLDEGPVGVAIELGVDPEDADAITRNALQLLRGALADVDLDEPAFYGRLERRRGGCAHRQFEPRRNTKAPDRSSGASRADPPGLPLGTDSLEATKVGTGGHGSSRRTSLDVLGRTYRTARTFHCADRPLKIAEVALAILIRVPPWRHGSMDLADIPDQTGRTGSSRAPTAGSATSRPASWPVEARA